MKKGIILLVALLFVFAVSSCTAVPADDTSATPAAWTEDLYASSYLLYFGVDQETMYQELGIEDTQAKSEDLPFTQCMEDVEIPNTEYVGQLWFYFDRETDQLYQFQYDWQADYSYEACRTSLESLLSYLTELYGEAENASHSNSISQMLETYENSKQKDGKYTETWNVPGEWHYESIEAEYPGKEIPVSASLQVEFKGDEVSYTLTYCLNVWNLKNEE